jgi:ribosome maturation factor RimP
MRRSGGCLGGVAGVQVREQVLALAEPLAEARGLILIDVEYTVERGRRILRCVLDKAGGITLDDIEGFHRALDPILDEADPIPGSYVLEVTSPGVDRPLRGEREFRLFAGRTVRVAARQPVDGRREWVGRLLGLEAGAVCIAFGPEEAERVAVPLDQVAWARLEG